MLKIAIKTFIPSPILQLYHKVLAVLANYIYGFPSRKMVVIGVTGTKGKSSTVVMITRILEEAGLHAGSMNTIFFKIGDKEWPNNKKQGMLGRLQLQKMLRRMVKKGCTHVVIEVTSEGILQQRQWGIAFDVAVFTNLSPEHIESHGSYKQYQEAKERIFKMLAFSYRKVFDDKQIKKIIVANADDKASESFLRHKSDEKWLVSASCEKNHDQDEYKRLCAQSIRDAAQGAVINVKGSLIQLSMHGEFMGENALLAIAAARSIGISFSACEQALERIKCIPGRAELVQTNNGFSVMIDYAHEPKSYSAVLETARKLSKDYKLIVVCGITGGGRDKARRPELGSIAAKYADYIVFTNEDPYDDDPISLINQIASGIPSEESHWQENTTWWRIVDRTQAIIKAISLARKGDVVLLLGKGSETVMIVKSGKHIPWSDRAVAEEILNKNQEL
jgi:UDP-N-acetylmuramoyl-L-alanyl-D-glutamate--2,6-diaminopimelate ligase